MAWYRKAVDAGNVSAMHNIGTLYVLGQGVPQDYAQALTWFRKGADAGDIAPVRLRRCDVCHRSRRGTGSRPGDDMVRKAADAGNTDAMHDIGMLYFGGLGVRQDYAEAMTWFRKAADAGNAVAMFHIATLYGSGQVLRKV